MADDSNTNTNASQDNGAAGAGGDGAGAQQSPVLAHMMQHKVETGLWLTRIFTVVCAVLFLLPIMGGNPYSWYQRAFCAAAASSALRLHQRIPQVQLNIAFLKSLLLEDSAHYLMYCIIFLNSQPITMALIPVFLFALLHACNFTKLILNLMGPSSMQFLRNGVAKLEAQQVNILRFIASTEIFLMPAVVIMIASGKASFFLPFLYYRFLTLRYSSRRNPYNRTLFAEFRAACEYLVSKPQCPAFLRNACFSGISFISRLAPQVQTA